MKSDEKHPKRFWQDEKWVNQHYGELVKKYPDMWVTVVNRKVIAAGESIEKIEKITKKNTGEEIFPVIFVEGAPAIYES